MVILASITAAVVLCLVITLVVMALTQPQNPCSACRAPHYTEGLFCPRCAARHEIKPLVPCQRCGRQTAFPVQRKGSQLCLSCGTGG